MAIYEATHSPVPSADADCAFAAAITAAASDLPAAAVNAADSPDSPDSDSDSPARCRPAPSLPLTAG